MKRSRDKEIRCMFILSWQRPSGVPIFKLYLNPVELSLSSDPAPHVKIARLLTANAVRLAGEPGGALDASDSKVVHR